MKRSHPIKYAIAFALRSAIVMALAGCSNQQMSASNPFMAPDRVPPPATRTIAPGTAAPYYPGDPVPAAQLTSPQPAMVAQAQPVPAPTVMTPMPPAPAQVTPQPLAFGTERSVAVPADNGDLRFALPSPPPVTSAQPTPLAASPAPIPMATPTPTQATAVAAAPPSSPVIPAAYNQPLASQPPPAAGPMPTTSAADNTGGPWRAPQIPNTGSPVAQAQYLQPQPVAPLQPQLPTQPMASTMPVQLQAVPPPATAPATMPSQVEPALPPPPPRMRFPSWTEPSTWFTPQPAANSPPPGQQLIGYMVPGPNGTPQMISVEQYQAMTTGAAQPAASVATSDGFRPRGSVTK
jgi:hypothetical protein